MSSCASEPLRKQIVKQWQITTKHIMNKSRTKSNASIVISQTKSQSTLSHLLEKFNTSHFNSFCDYIRLCSLVSFLILRYSIFWYLKGYIFVKCQMYKNFIKDGRQQSQILTKIFLATSR